MEVLMNLIVVIISQYIEIANHHIVELKLIQYVNYISIKLGKKEHYIIEISINYLNFGSKDISVIISSSPRP